MDIQTEIFNHDHPREGWTGLVLATNARPTRTILASRITPQGKMSNHAELKPSHPLSEPIFLHPATTSQPTMPDLPSIILRPCRVDDLDTVKAITAEAFNGVSIDQAIQQRIGSVGGRDWDWHKMRHLDHDFADGMIMVAENDAKTIVGYITMRIDREAKTGSIPNLAVSATFRGRGIGRLLLEHALETFRTEDLELARIETLSQNSLGLRLYTELGFEVVASQIHFAMQLQKPSKNEDGSET